MLSGLWVAMILGALICGALTGKLGAVATASSDSASQAVALAIGLVGVMTLWLGLMRVLANGGLLASLSRGLKPIMGRLFPEVPSDHPAMGAMILNLASNMLGLANAATPFGIKAMLELNRLNRTPGTATNAMALFLAINTSNVALLPTGVIALRAALGSKAPGSIILTTLCATTVSTITAIVMAKLFSRLPMFRAPAAVTPAASSELVVHAETPGDTAPAAEAEAEALAKKEPRRPRSFLAVVFWVALAELCLIALGVALYGEIAERGWVAAAREITATWPLIVIIVAIVLFGLYRRVKIYEAVVEGGKEGFQVAVRIIPFMVAMLVAVGMLRAAGAIDLLVQLLSPVTSLIGMPAEALPMALLRPLSGSGAFGVAADIMKTYGPDSFIGQVVSTMNGSSETTFYVLAVYFGAVAVRVTRHTLPACLMGDALGLVSSAWFCRWLLT